MSNRSVKRKLQYPKSGESPSAGEDAAVVGDLPGETSGGGARRRRRRKKKESQNSVQGEACSTPTSGQQEVTGKAQEASRANATTPMRVASGAAAPPPMISPAPGTPGRQRNGQEAAAFGGPSPAPYNTDGRAPRTHWAGGAHVNSPHPSSLPEPDFFEDEEEVAGQVTQTPPFPSAVVGSPPESKQEELDVMSGDLRRLLRMEC
mmetsp:Transcript_23434/g.65814  ORF Transcript_23434/g.65814 Transcript_23434/m.65814 type:complete len:205 (-) Transcript_23434:67-681(-)|eukprot:CAMPEP_0119133930 /NCGR_PEP_ID=MMETSP1310-20130426/14498_1 /TAXON_ID=464262 /ORGANISM="Genus nov. species nov., Strain RCC2339" /LENGTH=204 /DNA_ID=CAMNT_0007124665 /DNA_START=41 /DNA_END=655 /DNA_ORIENTATION=+